MKGTVSTGPSSYRGYDFDVFAYDGPVGSMRKRKGVPLRISLTAKSGIKIAYEVIGQLAPDAASAKELIELIVAKSTFTTTESLELISELAKALMKKKQA